MQKNISENDRNDTAVTEDSRTLPEGRTALEAEEDILILKLKTPYHFEGKKYDQIDLTGLYEVKAADMIAVSRQMSRSGNNDLLQEMTLEYALKLVARACGQPIEFYEQLPPRVALQIKNRVTGFLYGSD